jgi:putative glutamine amidotransferase
MRPRIGITSAPTVHDERRFDRVNRWYVDAVARAGGLPVILPTLSPDDAADVLDGLDGLLLSGGGDIGAWRYREEPAPEAYGVEPARDAWELALVAAVTAADAEAPPVGGPAGPGAIADPPAPTPAPRPVLGICRGAQLLNVAAAGTLIQHLPNVTDQPHWVRSRDQEEVHPVDLEPESRLAAIMGRTGLGVNTIHHQAIARVGEGWRAVAWAPDGIVEAIERVDGAPLIGVQWHPESLIDRPDHGRLFVWLTATAARCRPGLEVPAAFQPAPPPGSPFQDLVDDVA